MDDDEIAIATIAAALGGARHEADGWVAFCPIHETDGEHNPSLIMSAGRSRAVVSHCRAGCEQGAVAEAVDAVIARLEGGEDVAPNPAQPRMTGVGDNKHKRVIEAGAPVAAYEFVAADGSYVVTKIRYEADLDGETEKTFLFWDRDWSGARPRFGMPAGVDISIKL